MWKVGEQMTVGIIVTFYVGVASGFGLAILLTASKFNEQENYIAQLLKKIKE